MVLVAGMHFCPVSLARLSTVHGSQELARPGLDAPSTVVGAIAPLGPGQPLAVHRAVLQEAHLRLLVRALAVAPVVLGDGVGAASSSRLSTVVTGDTALAEISPLCPATINCTGRKIVFDIYSKTTFFHTLLVALSLIHLLGQ